MCLPVRGSAPAFLNKKEWSLFSHANGGVGGSGVQPIITFRWIRNHLPRCPSVLGWCVACPCALEVHPFPPARDVMGRVRFSGAFCGFCWGVTGYFCNKHDLFRVIPFS